MPSNSESPDLRTDGISATAYPVADFDSGTRRSGFGVGLDSPSQTLDYAVLKRGFDLFLILLSSPILLAVATVIGLCVMLTSPGPIFFSHRRISRGGNFFSMWKFRTMCVNSAEVLERHLQLHPEDRAAWARDHKLKNDPRVTPIGRFLRKSSLDELPQIWNVFCGRMSLVGPRPIVAAEVEKYRDDFAYYIAVKPGVTGLWQCSGRSTVSYDERVQLDKQYVMKWSLWLDVKILFKTISSVVNSDGAF